jgi:transcriptional regulator with XRE-family HTH domain
MLDGNQIRQFRIDAGMTQLDVCEATGLNHCTVASIENMGKPNVKSPLWCSVEKVLDAIGVTIELKKRVAPTLDDLLQSHSNSNGEPSPVFVTPKLRLRKKPLSMKN